MPIACTMPVNSLATTGTRSTLMVHTRIGTIPKSAGTVGEIDGALLTSAKESASTWIPARARELVGVPL